MGWFKRTFGRASEDEKKLSDLCGAIAREYVGKVAGAPGSVRAFDEMIASQGLRDEIRRLYELVSSTEDARSAQAASVGHAVMVAEVWGRDLGTRRYIAARQAGEIVRSLTGETQ